MSDLADGPGTPGRGHRRWPAHLAAVTVVLLAGVASFVGSVWWLVDLAAPCEASYSEATIVAPDSYRGRLLCTTSNGELGPSLPGVFALGAAPLLVAVAGLVWWIRGATWTRLLIWVLVAVSLPWAIRVTLHALPADCTPAQWDTYGPAGCERSEEQRGGINQY